MKNIGLIGLGNVGIPIAANLINAGFQPVGFRRGDADNFRQLGGVVARSAREVAERSEIILCCIPNDQALEDVISGPSGITQGDCAGRIIVELSTLSPATKEIQARAIAAKGGIMLDGAISGLPPMVAARQAIFLLSGDKEAFETVKAVLDQLTAKLFYMGDFGAAMKAKLCANMLVACNLAAAAETLAFGAKLGLDLDRLIPALKDGAGGSLQFTARAERMAKGDWQNALGSTAMLSKDIHLIEEAGCGIGCPTTVLSSAGKLYARAMEEGYAETDVASLYAVVAKAAGLRVPGHTTEI